MEKIKDEIINIIKRKGRANSNDIAKKYQISRQAAHLHFRALVKDRKLLRIGETRGSYYILYSSKKEKELGDREKKYNINLRNIKLEEDKVYNRILNYLPIIKSLPQNTQDIVYYAFSKMLNNAIEYSKSKYINIFFLIDKDSIIFEVKDKGVGVFKHIQKKFNLHDEYEALTELLKGKKTTMPSKHTGEGIFFTSKIADIYKIRSSKIMVIMDNKENDVFTEDISSQKGTQIFFQINKRTKSGLKSLFEQYTDNEYKFDKTKIVIKLYQREAQYMSRSQARRVILGLEKFKIIILNFDKVNTIGQSFADEIFRVFQNMHPGIKIEAINCCKAVEFMIMRAKSY